MLGLKGFKGDVVHGDPTLYGRGVILSFSVRV